MLQRAYVERGVRVAWGSAESNSSLLSALQLSNCAKYPDIRTAEAWTNLLFYNIIKAINAAINLKFYDCTACSKQYTSMFKWLYFFPHS